MDRDRTRKESYKLRKIGRYNYSLTIPPKIVDKLGGYDKIENVYFHIQDGNLIISPSKEIKEPTVNISIGTNCKPTIGQNGVSLQFDPYFNYYCVSNDSFMDTCIYGTLEDCAKVSETMFNVKFSDKTIEIFKKYTKDKTFN